MAMQRSKILFEHALKQTSKQTRSWLDGPPLQAFHVAFAVLLTLTLRTPDGRRDLGHFTGIKLAVFIDPVEAIEDQPAGNSGMPWTRYRRWCGRSAGCIGMRGVRAMVCSSSTAHAVERVAGSSVI